MGILKKGSYGGAPVSSFNYAPVNLISEDKTETIKFNREEYLAFIEEAKKEGYEEGLQKGYTDGYSQGASKFEEEKTELYASLESDKNAVKSFIENEAVKYVNSFQTDMQQLILNSINKLFFNCIQNDYMMQAYLDELITYLIKSFKDFSISANTLTISKISQVLDDNSIEYSVDESLKNYNIVVRNDTEHQEYFLAEEFKKIKELFE